LLSVFDAVSPIGFSHGKLTTAILPIYEIWESRLITNPRLCTMLPPVE